MPGKPLEPRILSILSHDQWRTRNEIARGLGRPGDLSPADIKRLDAMIEAGTIVSEWQTPADRSRYLTYRSVQPIEAWHFLQDNGTTGSYGLPVNVGETMRVQGGIVLCANGLHGSIRALDALQYAPGGMIQRAVYSGTIVYDEDKLVASHRRCLVKVDATRTMHEFAIWCAEGALNREVEHGNEVDARCWNAIAVKKLWLDKKATDDELAAARAAAWDAAWDAARAAARDAAWAAAWDAAWDAARAAARDAAWAAAWAAARDAAWAAAWAAAWDAAWDAAWAAARDAQNTEFEVRLNALIGAQS